MFVCVCSRNNERTRQKKTIARKHTHTHTHHVKCNFHINYAGAREALAACSLVHIGRWRRAPCMHVCVCGGWLLQIQVDRITMRAPCCSHERARADTHAHTGNDYVIGLGTIFQFARSLAPRSALHLDARAHVPECIINALRLCARASDSFPHISPLR